MDNKTFYNELYRDNQERHSFEIRSKAEAFKFLIGIEIWYIFQKNE